MTEALVCFKAYDIRGRVPEDLNEDIAYRIGRAYAQFLRPSKVVVGHDIRLSSPAIMGALINGLLDEGSDVYQIGQIGTEEIYFSTFAHNMDGGIAVTASHNPKNWNGMKFVREESKPISGDTGLKQIQALAQTNDFGDKAATPGKLLKLDHLSSYLEHLLSYVQVDKLKPLKIVVNAGNGGAGAIIDALEPLLPFEFIKLQHQADGNFPNGVPNPLLVENREITAKAIVEHNADLGIAWDGDFDRCFFFDHQGRFIEGYYIVGLLADAFLAKHKQASIVHDPRLTWNTQAIVEQAGGKAVCSKTGHAFIKERMRLEDAVYGGEMSAHHYFKDFAYCDSGMIPWLLITELMLSQNCTLASMVDDRMALFPASGEINRRVDDAQAMIATVEQQYAGTALRIDRTDGLSIEYEQWRFNLRSSNTEPVVRLNVESRADTALMQQKTEDLLVLMGGEPA